MRKRSSKHLGENVREGKTPEEEILMMSEREQRKTHFKVQN